MPPINVCYIPLPLQDGPPASIQTSSSSSQVYSCQMQRDLHPGFSNFEVQLNSRSKPCEANIYLDVTDCKCCFAFVEICCKWFPVWGFTPVENIHFAFICTLFFYCRYKTSRSKLYACSKHVRIL